MVASKLVVAGSVVAAEQAVVVAVVASAAAAAVVAAIAGRCHHIRTHCQRGQSGFRLIVPVVVGVAVVAKDIPGHNYYRNRDSRSFLRFHPHFALRIRRHSRTS